MNAVVEDSVTSTPVLDHYRTGDLMTRSLLVANADWRVSELAEFLVDSFGNPVLPGQPSLHDTDLDLIGDTVGAMLAAIHLQYTEFIEQMV